MRLALLLTVLASTFVPASLAAAQTSEILAITIEPRALYLSELREGGGRHGGPELAIGLRIPFDLSWAVVLRARTALAFDIESPAGEVSNVSCGGYYVFPCGLDVDMRYPVGGEVGVRFDDVTLLDDATQLVLGAELLVSGSAYLDSYEETEVNPGALGGALALTLELLFGERWGVGGVGGGRVEAGLDGRAAWAALHAGLRISRRF
ncbi:MAG: hypothetical protein ACK5U8_24900 [Deltaproteobacteria bacterium]